MKLKPNPPPYTHDYPNTLLFDTQEKFLAHRFKKLLNFVVGQT